MGLAHIGRIFAKSSNATRTQAMVAGSLYKQGLAKIKIPDPLMTHAHNETFILKGFNHGGTQ